MKSIWAFSKFWRSLKSLTDFAIKIPTIKMITPPAPTRSNQGLMSSPISAIHFSSSVFSCGTSGSSSTKSYPVSRSSQPAGLTITSGCYSFEILLSLISICCNKWLRRRRQTTDESRHKMNLRQLRCAFCLKHCTTVFSSITKNI